MSDETRFLTINQTANELKILSSHALRMMVKANQIPYVMVGTRCYINIPKLKEVLNIEDTYECS